MLRKNFNLNNKVIIITGGAGLLGERFAKVIAGSQDVTARNMCTPMDIMWKYTRGI